MIAKVIFFMQNRTEHSFMVEAEDQQALRMAAEIRLNEKLARMSAPDSGVTLSDGWNVVTSWRTIPQDGKPGCDKHDGVAARSSLQKIRFDLLPMGPITEVVRVLTDGAYRYGDRNWEAGFSWSRCVGSAWRHFTKWVLGENYDDESGLHHLAHVIANCLFLLQYTLTNTGTDDRATLPSSMVTALFKPINSDKKQKRSYKSRKAAK